MWLRNLLFFGLCVVVLAGLAASLLHYEQPEVPAGFVAGRYEQDSYRRVIEQVNAEWRQHWDCAIARRNSTSRGTFVGRIYSSERRRAGLDEAQRRRSADCDGRLRGGPTRPAREVAAAL